MSNRKIGDSVSIVRWPTEDEWKPLNPNAAVCMVTPSQGPCWTYSRTGTMIPPDAPEKGLSALVFYREPRVEVSMAPGTGLAAHKAIVGKIANPSDATFVALHRFMRSLQSMLAAKGRALGPKLTAAQREAVERSLMLDRQLGEAAQRAKREAKLPKKDTRASLQQHRNEAFREASEILASCLAEPFVNAVCGKQSEMDSLLNTVVPRGHKF